MPRTIIHIGMPRAASTYFQQVVFPNLEGFNYLGIEFTQYSDLFQRIMYEDDYTFDFEAIQKQINKVCEGDTILSNEVFVGQSLYLSSTNRSRTADRLKRLLPNAEILIVLRNQVSLIQSIYAIAVYAGYTGSETDFVKFTEKRGEEVPSLIPTYEEGEATNQYFYSKLVETYTTRFSKTHLVLFEDFKSNSDSFFEELKNKLQVQFEPVEDKGRVNSSLSRSQISLLRTLNLWKPLLNSTRFGRWIFQTKIRFIEHRLKGNSPFRIDSSLASKIKLHYADDNAKLLESYPELDAGENFKKKYL